MTGPKALLVIEGGDCMVCGQHLNQGDGIIACPGCKAEPKPRALGSVSDGGVGLLRDAILPMLTTDLVVTQGLKRIVANGSGNLGAGLGSIIPPMSMDMEIRTREGELLATMKGGRLREVEHPRVFAWTDCPLFKGQPQAIRYVEVVTWDRDKWCTVRWQGGIYEVKRWYLYTKLGRWKADGWYDGRGRWRRNAPMLLKRTLLPLPSWHGDIAIDFHTLEVAKVA
jgi:hypothetical protein